MKRYLTMALAAATMLCSCQKEFDRQQNTDKNAEFTATMEMVTKATLEGMTPSWEEGDEINIEGKTYIAQSSGTTTTFKPKADPSPREINHYAFFSAYWDGEKYDLSDPEFLIPANINETWSADKFNMPMYAHSNTNELQFKNLCGVLKIVVKSDRIPAVKRISIDSYPRQMNGYCIVRNDGARFNRLATEWGEPTTVTYSEAVKTTAEGVAFYIAVVPREYEDIKIQLDPDGNGYTKIMSTIPDKKITIERNKIYTIVFEDNSPAPTRGTAKATIEGKEVDVPWVQLWENGPKWAEYNVGVTDGKPESYGGHYCWGGSIDRDPNRTYKHGTEALSGNDDTAKAVWGSNWRMPTKEELELLHNGEKTDTDWTTVNGVKCKSFKGRDKYKDNIIYMPAAGYYDGRLINDGDNGYCYCWTSTPYPSESNDYSWHLILMNGVKQFTYHHRDCESSVRAVLMETNYNNQ